MIEDNYRKNFIEAFRKRVDIDLENKKISNYLFEIMEEKDKEIERLTKQNKTLNEMYELTKKEYIRLNNIINEIEAIIYNNQITGIEARLEIQERLDKLQELKGSE